MTRRSTNGRRQVFRVIEPDAQRVLLVGDFTHWEERAIPMQNGTDSVWTATVILPPEAHQYLFLADGKWREDPECTVRAPNTSYTFNGFEVGPDAFPRITGQRLSSIRKSHAGRNGWWLVNGLRSSAAPGTRS